MSRVNKTQVPQIAQALIESLKTTDFERLSKQFNSLVEQVENEIIKPNREKGKVELLGYEFQIKPKEDSRQTGRNLASTNFATNASYASGVIPPTQLVLTNTKKTAQIQKISITIPNVNNPESQMSMLTVEDRNGLTTTLNPKSNTFIQRDPSQNGRTRITAEEVKKEH
jgi:hypothetical protein